MFVTKTILIKSSVMHSYLVTQEVDDAITQEHAVSISAGQMTYDGFGNADLGQAWEEVREGVSVWNVQWRVSLEDMQAYLFRNPGAEVLYI